MSSKPEIKSMTKIQKIFLLMLVFFLAAIPVWRFLLVPELLKLPKDLQREFDLLTTTDTNYDLTNWEGERIEIGYLKDTPVSSSKDNHKTKSKFRTETLSGELSWEIENVFTIDRKTHRVIEAKGEIQDDTYYYFPRNVEQKNYESWVLSSSETVPMSFVNKEEIKDLATLHFVAEDSRKENTVEFSWLELVPETYNATSVQSVDIWIEPVTGILVKHEDSGSSYYVDKNTGEIVGQFNKWANAFSDDTIANQVRIAQNEKQKIILYERWIPILFGLISLAFLIALFASRKVALKPSN